MNVPVPNIDLRPDHWGIVRNALRQHVPDREVLAFGSRATWTAKDYSDLDLAIMGEEPLPPPTASALSEAIGDSDLPFRVDIVEWARIDNGFRSIIRQDGVVVQAAEGASTGIRSRQIPSPSGKSLDVSSQLSVHAEIVMGQSPPGNKSNTTGKGVPLLNGPTGFGSHHPEPTQYTTDVRKAACPGDLLFCVRGSTTGRMNWADQDYAIGRGIAAIRHKRGQEYQPFVRAVIEYSLPSLLKEATGSTFPNVSAGQLAGVSWPALELTEQRAVAHILGTLDDKIELNRLMNETLEAMARALFKSWFVDFDPVRTKMKGRDTGLPTDIVDLFPDRLVDSEMGEIPHGWEAKSLKDCMNLTMGQSPPGSTYNDQGDGLPFFQGRAEFGFRYPEKRRFCSAPTRVANPDDTLVSVRAPVGDINLAWERCCIGRGVAALRHKSGSSSFTYHSAWALRRELEEYEHTGTVFGAINKSQFEALKVTEPDPRIVEAFDTMAANLDARIRSNVRETHTLAALRDTLLPELISGELRLRDAEWFGPEISFNATRVPG